MQTQTTADKYNIARVWLPPQWYHFLPFVLLLAMAGAIFFLNAVLPLRGLGYSEALLPRAGSWILWPTHVFFPNHAVITSHPVSSRDTALPSFLALSWNESFFLFGAFLSIVLLYLLALSILPRYITYRYIIGSTLVLGVLYVLIPVVTSQDLFSYIGYARMEVIYHLNPLTAPPTAIRTDPIYSYIHWIHLPSIYGPTWIYISAALQWLANVFGLKSVQSMVLLLRLFGLSIHLSSIQLLWMLSGRLQRLHGSISPQVRAQGVLAFAWNPLLLFEACVNAHNDAVILFFVLLALWLLVSGAEIPFVTLQVSLLRRLWRHTREKGNRRGYPAPRQGTVVPCIPAQQLLPFFVTLPTYISVAAMLALATCVKINIALLAPGLLLYVWQQPHRLRNSITVGAVYIGTIVILYAPFWQHGAIVRMLPVNPGIYGEVNTLAEFFSNLYRSVAGLLGLALSTSAGTITRTVSLLMFAVAYGVLCWKTIANRDSLLTPLHLIRWMVLAWLLYCALGSPWFWPWYTATFFGLLALIASVKVKNTQEPPFFTALRSPLTISLFTFSMLSLYCFFTLGPVSSVIPWLPPLRWTYLRGLWAWLVPPLVLLFGF